MKTEDLLEGRAWYDKIRPELGERFALAVEATVKVTSGTSVAIHHRLPESSAGLGAALPLRNILRSARQSDCGDSLLPREAQSKALAIAMKGSLLLIEALTHQPQFPFAMLRLPDYAAKASWGALLTCLPMLSRASEQFCPMR